MSLPAPTALRFEHRPGRRPGARHRHARRPGCRGRCRTRPTGYRQGGVRGGGRRTGRRRRGRHASSRPSRCWCPGRSTPLASRERAEVRVRVRAARGERRLERVERARRRRGRAARRRRLDRPLRQPAPASAASESPAPVLARRRSTCRRTSSGPGSTPPRTASTSPSSTATGSATTSSPPAGPATSTGCATRPTTSPTCVRPGANTPRGAARQRLVPRPARLQRRAAPSTATGSPLLAQLEVTTADGAGPRARPPTSTWTATRERGRSPTTSTTASAPTCAATRSADGGDDAGRRRRRRPRPAGRPGRPAGARHRRAARPSRSVTSPSGHDAGRLRPERGRLGPAARPRRRRRRRGRPCGTPRCSRTASSASGRCAPRKATDTYLLAGADEELLEPTLTFHGFRYAEVDRRRRTCAPEDIEAVVVGTDLRRTGWFDSSHELLNRFHENVVWGMRGNFVDVPTDCPQRDERLGWTGDIQVFSPTASFLFDSAGFLTTWLADLAAEQQKDGSVPFVVPDVLQHAGPAGRGLGRRGHDRAVGALPAHRRRRACWPASCRACAPGSTRSPAWPAPTGCGPAASSSATGSTRPRRRTTRPRQGRPRRRRHRAPRPLGRDRRAGRRGARRRRHRPRGTRDLAAEVRAGLRRASTSPPSGRVLSDAQTGYALALRVGAAADRRAARSAPAGGWPTWSGRRASGSAPASSARR